MKQTWTNTLVANAATKIRIFDSPNLSTSPFIAIANNSPQRLINDNLIGNTQEGFIDPALAKKARLKRRLILRGKRQNSQQGQTGSKNNMQGSCYEIASKHRIPLSSLAQGIC